MAVSFDPRLALVVIPVELSGPSGAAVLRLALDTGATDSVISNAMLVAVGYDPASAAERVQVTTGSGVEFVPRVLVNKLAAIDRVLTDFPVLAHTLPPSAAVDGLLGLNFLRGCTLKIDFQNGTIAVE